METHMNFDVALSGFIDAINDGIKEHSKRYSNLEWSETDPDAYFQPVGVTNGKRYVKLFYRRGVQNSVYCFVDKTNGDILMAATWKAPAKGSRGNIYNPADYLNVPKEV